MLTVQVIIIPIIFKESEEVLQACEELKEKLEATGIRVKIDASDKRPGAKYYRWEMQGVPLRIELGPRDLKNNAAMLARRDNGEKSSVPLDNIVDEVHKIFVDIQENLYSNASKNLEDNIYESETIDSIKENLPLGIVKSYWCGEQECGLEMEEAIGAGILGIPTDQPSCEDKVCPMCGSQATNTIYIARTY